ncbi:MFS transporter [Flavobacteriaceae bacterium 144Ye]|nr:MFS transporter [Flavobacteriaceae bacterium 144Ye]
MKSQNIKPHKTLTNNVITRYVSFSILYLAQGIPEGITFYAIPAWLAMNGKSPAEIATFISIALIPWSFKIVVAPLMDRYTFLSMGRKRPWVILGQLGLILSFLAYGVVPDPLNNITGLMVAGFCVNFFGAFQDVATDGMAIDMVPVKEQARANGLMWGTKIIGTSLSLLVGTFLINTIGFSLAISSVAITVALIILVPIFIKERPGEKLLPWTKGKISSESLNKQSKNWKQLLNNLLKVVKQPTSMLFLIAVFVVSNLFGVVDALFPIFTVQELGWTNTSFSQVFSTVNIISGIVGMLIGGYLVDKHGKLKMINHYLILIIISILIFSFLVNSWSSKIVVYGFMFLYGCLYVSLTIAIFAAAMHLCWKTVAASQFTLYMTISNLGRSTGAALLGMLKSYFSWEVLFLLIALIPLLTIVILKFTNFKKHQEKVKSFKNINISYSD